MVRTVDVSPEEIAAIIENPVDKKIALAILQVFSENELTYQTRTMYKPSNVVEPDDYRVFCYIKKSREALIINTKWENLFRLQIRILNKAAFEKLDEYSENIRNQILNARNCGNCPCKKKITYDFAYKGKQYKKCYMLCSNFWLCNFNADDIDSIIDIVKGEIEHGKPSQRRRGQSPRPTMR